MDLCNIHALVNTLEDDVKVLRNALISTDFNCTNKLKLQSLDLQEQLSDILRTIEMDCDKK